MAIRWSLAPNALLNATLLLLGLILAAVPLVLWVVWSESLFYGVIAVFALALPLYGILSWFELRDGADRATTSKPEVSAAFIDEAQRLQPMVHHHFRGGTARFHRAMARLKSLAGQRDA